MPLPSTELSAYSVSFEQVVPAGSPCSEDMQFMEAELPTEKGAAGSSLMEFQTQDTVDKAANISTTTCQENSPKNSESDNKNRGTARHSLGFEEYSSQFEEQANQESLSSFPVQNDPLWQDSLEGECDMGYSSHSACSSCQQGSQVDTGLSAADYFEYAEEDFNGNEEMEDLLFHFDKFFRNKYEEILMEQQTHVRQIVKKVIKTCGDKDCFSESIEVTDKATQTDPVNKFSLPSVMLKNSLSEACCRSDNNGIQTSLRAPDMETDQNNRVVLNEKEKLLQTIISFTCDITRLLQRQEYKT